MARIARFHMRAAFSCGVALTASEVRAQLERFAGPEGAEVSTVRGRLTTRYVRLYGVSLSRVAEVLRELHSLEVAHDARAKKLGAQPSLTLRVDVVVPVEGAGIASATERYETDTAGLSAVDGVQLAYERALSRAQFEAEEAARRQREHADKLSAVAFEHAGALVGRSREEIAAELVKRGLVLLW